MESRVPRRVIIANFVKIGQSVLKILQFFFDFPRWWLPQSWIFEIAKFYWRTGSRGSRCISMPDFVQSMVAKMLRFFDFSATFDLFGHMWTTHTEYLGVSITLQNLVMINAVDFSARCNIYISRLSYDASVRLSICLTFVHSGHRLRWIPDIFACLDRDGCLYYLLTMPDPDRRMG